MFSRDISKLAVRSKNGRHDHSVQFYSNDAVFLDELSRYVGGALGRGDSAIVIATPSHREGLRQRLHRLGFDTSYSRLKRRYLEFDAAETLSQFMVDGLPDAASFSEIVTHVLVKARVAAEGEHPHVFAFGEMVALLVRRATLERRSRWSVCGTIWRTAIRSRFTVPIRSPRFTAGMKTIF